MVAEYLLTELTPTSPTTSYLTNDTLGSPRVITDSSGTITSRRDFMPFGEEISAIGGRTSGLGYQTDATRQKFTSYERDNETDLDFAQARMYSNKLGRFTVTDPTLLSVKAINPQTWNRYVYVLNNPLLYTDPLGLWHIHEEQIKAKKGDKEFIRIVVKVYKTGGKSDTAETLAKQLGLSSKSDIKEIEKQLAKAGGDGLRLSQLDVGNVKQVFKDVEEGLTNQANWKGETPGDPNADCSETAMSIGFGENFSGGVGTPIADQLLRVSPLNPSIGEYDSEKVKEKDLKVEDVVRWEDKNKPQHFANFILRDDDNEPVVFSKTGKKGPYEIKTVGQITSEHSSYGKVSGYHRPIRPRQ